MASRELSASSDEATIRGFLDAADPPALRECLGMAWLDISPGSMTQGLSPSQRIVEADGSVSLGALAVLADSTAGSAGSVLGGYRYGVTIGLRVELAEAVPATASVTAAARPVRAAPEGSLVHADLRAEGRLVGTAQMRGVSVSSAGAGTRDRDASSLVSPRIRSIPCREGDLVDATFGVVRIEASGGLSRLHVEAPSALANGAGRLHGGAVAAAVHRAARYATASVEPDGFTDLLLDVDLVRPVPPGGVTLEAVGEVEQRTRRFVWARADLLLPDGRLAARARTFSRCYPGGPATPLGNAP